MDKPVTMQIEEFKEKIVKDINECELPVWLIVDILSPFIAKLQKLSELQAEAEKNRYLEYLKGENENGVHE